MTTWRNMLIILEQVVYFVLVIAYVVLGIASFTHDLYWPLIIVAVLAGIMSTALWRRMIHSTYKEKEDGNN